VEFDRGGEIHQEEGSMLEDDRRTAKIKLNPASYPFVQLIWEGGGQQDFSRFEEQALFPMEWWSSLAYTAEVIVDEMDTTTEENQKLAEILTSISDRIKTEIALEEKRLRYKDSYESFADYVGKISQREDLDNLRKAQMIHDMALQLKLDL
jgi:hypothetical protein